jgi:hypothetical protein
MSNRAIDRVIEHWRATRGQQNHIKAFGGLDIYWGPWTLGEQDRVYGPFIDGTTGVITMRPAMFARALLVKATDVSGSPLFDEAEETELLAEANPTELHRVARAILATLDATNDAANGGESPNA